jgi:predicted lipoprotein
MKKLLSLILPLALPVAIGLTSCSDSDEPSGDTPTARETTFQNAANAFVTNTVRPTYKGMADAAIALYNDCVTISEHHAAGTLTTADITAAANDWKESRRNWELSEAFLFGPAGDYNIDPHIDSWPLDKDAMERLLTDIRNGAEYSIDNNFGYGLLGFHSIEYMLFELSADETTSSIHSLTYTTEEIKYLLMVAEDLRNQCVYLEACWAGEENISQEKLDILEEAELGVSRNYGDMMINAGQAGSIYKTYQETAEEIIQGCIDIADEVGNQKIGRPVLGASDEDKNYIESPYSLNSIEDFKDNIRSIRNSYFGSNSGDASISDYIKSVNPTLNSEVSTAIENAINAIDAIPEPFAKNANTQAAKNAVTVVGTDLVNTLNKVYTQLSND